MTTACRAAERAAVALAASLLPLLAGAQEPAAAEPSAGWNVAYMGSMLATTRPIELALLLAAALPFAACCYAVKRGRVAALWAVPAVAVAIAPLALALLAVMGQLEREVTPFRIYSLVLPCVAAGALALASGPASRAGLVAFLLAVAGWFVEDVFRYTHLDFGAPLAIAATQLAALALWWFTLGRATRPAVARPQTAAPPPAPRSTPEPQPAPAAPPPPPAAAPPPPPAPSVFLSYRRDDSADVAGRIYDRLVAAFGTPGVFKDVDSIPLGTDFRTHLKHSLGECNVVLVLIGRDWLVPVAGGSERRIDQPGDVVRIEVEEALARELRVIPVTVRGAAMPARETLPPSIAALADRNGIAVRPDPDFHRDMDRLIAALDPRRASG